MEKIASDQTDSGDTWRDMLDDLAAEIAHCPNLNAATSGKDEQIIAALDALLSSPADEPL